MDEKPLKILYITPCYEPAYEMGGVVRSTSLLGRGLVKLGQEVTVLTTNLNPLGKKLEVPLAEEINRGGVKVYYFPGKLFAGRFFYSPLFTRKCDQIIGSFDLVHLSAFWSYLGIVGARLARKHNIPYILSPRGTLNPYSLKQGELRKKLYLWFFEKKNLKGVAAIHYTSELEKRMVHDYQNLNNPFFVVPNPVPVQEFAYGPDKLEAKEHFQLSKNSTVISSVGRLHKRKALDLLINSFAQLVKDFENCYLLIAGPDDGDEARLKSLVKKYGLQEKVKFLGFVDAKQRSFVLAASDFFWLAAYGGENFGHAAVEAMAAGVPVILSQRVGIWQDVVEDNAGVVVPFQTQKVVEILKEILQDKERRLEMANNARISAWQRYSQEKVCQRMLLEYRKIVKEFRK
jgi:glycosyltransferase involved in cell wall biosynthesis